MKKALIFGASGLIGSHLLNQLLNSSDYDQVTVVVRKKLPLQHAKLKMLIGDYQSLPTLKSQLVVDDVFIALGTTKKNTPDQEQYYQVDHDYPVLAAKLALENGARWVGLVSAVGADSKSKVFYVRTKGDVERDLQALGFPHTAIFRPSMLLGDRKEDRPLERIMMGFWPKLNPLLQGSLSRYRGIEGKAVAAAMIQAAKSPQGAVKIYEWQEMQS